MTSNEPNMCPRMALPSSNRLETVPNGRPGSSDRLFHAPLHEDVHRSSAALTSARIDANEIRHLSASPPVDVQVPAEAGAGTYTTLNGDYSPATQTNAGDGSAQSYGPITLLSDIPASDVSIDYLGNLFTHDPARLTSGDTTTSHNQRQPPAALRLNGHASIGAFPDLARSTTIDTSCSDDQVHSPAEVSVNAYESRAVETLDSETQHELDGLLARIEAFVAGDPNPSMEEQPSALAIHGRQRSPGAPHGPEDMAAAARLLQLRAVEVPNRESYALEHQTSRKRAEEFGEDLEDSTELWQVAFDEFGQRIDHNNFLDQILADWDAQSSLEQLPTSVGTISSLDWEQWPFAVDGEHFAVALNEDPELKTEQCHMEPRRRMEQEVDALVSMGAIDIPALEDVKPALFIFGCQTVGPRS